MKLPCPWALPKDGRAQSSSCHCHMAEVTWETRGSVPDSQTSDTGMGGRPRGLCPSGPGTPVRPGARPRLGPARAASPLCSPPQHGREPPCAGFGEHAPGRMCAGGTHTEPQRWGHSKEGTRRPGGPARLAAAGAASPPPRAAGDGKSSRSRVLRVPRGGVALRRAQGCGAEQTVFQACMPAVRGSGRAHTTVHQNRPRHSSPHGPDALHRLPDQGQGAAERPGSSGAAAAGGGVRGCLVCPQDTRRHIPSPLTAQPRGGLSASFGTQLLRRVPSACSSPSLGSWAWTGCQIPLFLSAGMPAGGKRWPLRNERQ